MKVLEKILTRWRILFWIKTGLTMVFAELFLILILYPSVTPGLFLVTSLGVIGSILAYGFHHLPQKAEVILLINEQLTEVPYSASLLEQSDLNALQQLQLQKVLIATANKKLRFPLSYYGLLWTLLLGGMLFLISFWGKTVSYPKGTDPKHDAVSPAAGQTTDSLFYQVKMTVSPPSYTGMGPSSSSNLTPGQIPEASTVQWSWQFNRPVSRCWVRFSNGDSTGLTNSDHLKLVRVLHETVFYSFHYVDLTGKIIDSDLFLMEVIPDAPPEILITGIDQYQQFEITDNPVIRFAVTARDQYGLSDVHLVTTLTKGSGESVKFREEHLPLGDSPFGKSLQKTLTLSAKQLEMEPGNELYFYAEARDNGSPTHVTRTETYFFIIRDTAETAFSLEGDLGVDLMPEYFRSQRQIIIDSEKLLKERSSITREAFNERSNSLAADEKALRLKYGQFVGEEASDELAEEEEPHDDATTPGQVNVLAEYGHDHDHENEAGENLERGTENPASAFAHSHDDAESNTFFHQSLKAKLKAAIAEMWNAELHLRMYDPAASLPYQYKALTLLQDIKNQARIYVHKMGFDAPPLKEKESRLKGKLEEVTSKSQQTDRTRTPLLPGVKRALAALQKMESVNTPVENTLENVLHEAGNEIASLTIRNPARYLEVLSTFQTLQNQKQLDQEDLYTLKRLLLSVLPEPEQLPTLQEHSADRLLQDFIQQVTTSDHAF